MVHPAENLATAAVVVAQFVHLLFRVLDSVLIGAEQLRRGMAESKNRLIDISHGEESIGTAQQIQQPPLERIGVLQFIHQNVVEVVLDFFAPVRIALQKIDGSGFQVGEIQQRSRGFPGAEAHVDLLKRFDNEFAFGCVEHDEKFSPHLLYQFINLVALFPHPAVLHQSSLIELFGIQQLEVLSRRNRLEGKHFTGPICEPRVFSLLTGCIRLDRFRQDVAQQVAQALKRISFAGRFQCGGINGGAGHSHRLVDMDQRFGEVRHTAIAIRCYGQGIEESPHALRVPGVNNFQYFVCRLALQLAAHRFVGYLKERIDPCRNGILLQQARAESVNRRNIRAFNALASTVVVDERAHQALLDFRGSLFGKGNCQDAIRLDIQVTNQPAKPFNQHAGLPRPRPRNHTHILMQAVRGANLRLAQAHCRLLPCPSEPRWFLPGRRSRTNSSRT